MLDLDSLVAKNDRQTAQNRIAHAKNLLVLAVRRKNWAKATHLAGEIGRYERFLSGRLKRYPGPPAPIRRREPRLGSKPPARRARKARRRDNRILVWV